MKKLMSIQRTVKNNNFRGINAFNRDYQPRNNLVKDENVYLPADSHNIFKLEELLSVLNVHNVSDVRQIEAHTAEPLVPGPSHFGVEIVIAKLKKINQILA
jgi:hypothetical protein